ncbi:Nn.00g068940.m01.CDS01 [Neocucurbitaria sp. VM-36]
MEAGLNKRPPKREAFIIKGISHGTGGWNNQKLFFRDLKDVDEGLALDIEDEAPPPLIEKPKKSLLGSLLAEAKTGGKDFGSSELKNGGQQKKEEDERTHGPPNQLLPSKGETRQSTERVLSTGLPSLETLHQLGNALNNGTAYKKGSAYRPESPYHPKSPHLQDHFYPVKTPQRYQNSSQVSFCKHQDLRIEWDPLDPDNKLGSWKLSMKDYSRSPSEHDDHKSCQPPDRRQRVKTLAERIIQKFVDMENGKLTPQDRRNGIEPRVPPPNNRVEREIHNMISQMSRGKNERLIEKREAARVTMDACDGKKELDAKAPHPEQHKRRASEKAKLPGANCLEDGDPGVKSRRLKKSEIKGADIFVQSMLQRQVNQKRKPMAAPERRYKPSTMHERDEQKAVIAEQVRRDRAALSSHLLEEKRKEMSAPKQAEPLQKTQETKTIESDSEEDAQYPPYRVVSKRSGHARRATKESLDEEDQGEHAEQFKATQAIKAAEKLQETVKATMKPKPREITAEERALLAGINHAEEEENEQYANAEHAAEMEAENDSQPASPDIPEDDDEDEELRNELLAMERARLVQAIHHPTPTPTNKTKIVNKAVDEKEVKEVEDCWDIFETAKLEVHGPQQAEDEDEDEHKTSVLMPEMYYWPEGDEAANAGDKALDEANQSSKPVKRPVKKSVSKKRKAPVVEEGKDEQPQKKTRKVKKSAAIVEDSDDDAEYALPDATTNLPENTIRQGWQAEEQALADEIVHQQVEQETHDTKEEEGANNELSTQNTPPSPSSPPKKRKTPPPASQTHEITTSQPPTKKLKLSSPPSTSSFSSPPVSPKSQPTPAPQPPSTPPPSPPSPSSSSTPSPSKKRKSPFEESEDEDDGDGGDEGSDRVRPSKKVKKVTFELEVTSPVEGEREREMGVLDVGDGEGGESKDGTVGVDEGDGVEDGGDSDFDYLFEE